MPKMVKLFWSYESRLFNASPPSVKFKSLFYFLYFYPSAYFKMSLEILSQTAGLYRRLFMHLRSSTSVPVYYKLIKLAKLITFCLILIFFLRQWKKFKRPVIIPYAIQVKPQFLSVCLLRNHSISWISALHLLLVAEMRVKRWLPKWYR